MKSKKTQDKNPEPIDLADVLERIGGDKSFLQELLDIYFEDFSEKHSLLQKAVSVRDYRQIEELGHSLRGASANLSLGPLREASSEMETAGKKQDGAKAGKTLAVLRREMERLKEFLS